MEVKTFYPKMMESRAQSFLQNLTHEAVPSPINSRLLLPDQNLIRKLLDQEKDERYRYLLRHGNLHYIEQDSYSLYVELPQIPNIIIVYRRP